MYNFTTKEKREYAIEDYENLKTHLEEFNVLRKKFESITYDIYIDICHMNDLEGFVIYRKKMAEELESVKSLLIKDSLLSLWAENGIAEVIQKFDEQIKKEETEKKDKD